MEKIRVVYEAVYAGVLPFRRIPISPNSHFTETKFQVIELLNNNNTCSDKNVHLLTKLNEIKQK